MDDDNIRSGSLRNGGGEAIMEEEDLEGNELASQEPETASPTINGHYSPWAGSPAASSDDDGDDDDHGGDELSDRDWSDVYSAELASADGNSGSINNDGEDMSESDANVDSTGRSAAGDGNRNGNSIPYLWDLSDQIGRGIRVEGGAGVRLNRRAKDSLFYPFPNLTVLLLFVFGHTHPLSQRAMDDLFFILRFTFTDHPEVAGSAGCGDRAPREYGFKWEHVPRNGAHFLSRSRKFLPLLEVVEDTVPSTAGGGGTSKVYLFPLPSILDRILRSRKAVQRLEENAVGHVLRGTEALSNGVAADHVFPVPTRNIGDRKECNLNGDLARGCGLYSADGIMGTKGNKLFPGDLVTCTDRRRGGGDLVPCRLLELFFDEEESAMRVTLRRLRRCSAIRGNTQRCKSCQSNPEGGFYKGVPCVWEEIGREPRFTGTPEDLGDLCVVLTPKEIDDRASHGSPVGEASSVFAGAGFCRLVSRRRGGAAQQPEFVPTAQPWSKKGTRRAIRGHEGLFS